MVPRRKRLADLRRFAPVFSIQHGNRSYKDVWKIPKGRNRIARGVSPEMAEHKPFLPSRPSQGPAAPGPWEGRERLRIHPPLTKGGFGGVNSGRKSPDRRDPEPPWIPPS